MEKIRLGRTDIMAGRTAFGVLPLQRTEKAEAVKILRKAYDGGIDFYDTARSYTDSEEKIGLALASVRKNITIATKTPARDGEAMRTDLRESLKMLKTDYIDLYQLHNPPEVPKPGNGLYDTLEVVAEGPVRAVLQFTGPEFEGRRSAQWDSMFMDFRGGRAVRTYTLYSGTPWLEFREDLRGDWVHPRFIAGHRFLWRPGGPWGLLPSRRPG